MPCVACSVWRSVEPWFCCVSVMCCVHGVCVVCVCWCVCWCWCGTLKTTVCALKTSSCVRFKKCPVCTGNMPTCTHTRGRFQCTHGGRREEREEQGWSSSVLFTKICPRRVIKCFRGSPKETFWILPRSRTTRSRFLQSFAFLDKAV